MFAKKTVAAVIVTWLAGAGVGAAQGIGVTGGAHVNPDQIQGGALYDFEPLAERLRLRPAATVGLGNGATLLALNADIVYDLAAFRRSPWRPYVGGGPAINHYRLELYSQTEAGITALGGFRHANGWFSELRLGFIDGPDVTAAVGYSFGARQRRPPAARRSSPARGAKPAAPAPTGRPRR